MNAKPKNNKENKEKEKEKTVEEGANDIRSRLRNNPNKIKPLYTEDYIDKKAKEKSNEIPLSEKETCRKILEILKNDEKSILFRQPAIKAFIDKEDKDYYKQQIKEPRDLGNITKKLKSTKYTAKEFHDDLELCWSNALLFNENTTDAYKNAEYLKDLCEKLYKEYKLFDFINKEQEKNNEKDMEKNKDNTPDNNINKIEDNKNINNNEMEIEQNENINNNIINDVKNNNINEEKKNSNKTKKNIGRKRKRNDLLKETEDLEEKRNTKRNESINFNFDDIRRKFIIKHQIMTSPSEIPKYYEKAFIRPKKRIRKTSNKKIINKKENHTHHTKMNHILYVNKDKKPLFNEKDYPRKINFGFVEIFHHNAVLNKNISKEEKDEIEIDISFGANDNSQNNKSRENIDNNDEQNNSKLNMYFNKTSLKTENEQMAKYDFNYNSENVYDFNSKKDVNKKGNKDFVRNNNLNNQFNLYNIGNIKTNMYEQNNTGHKNKKNDKNFELRKDIAKYFDQLSDSAMIELLVYIENIRPQAIKELANDTIYINMELFNDETFSKVLEFVKKFV